MSSAQVKNSKIKPTNTNRGSVCVRRLAFGTTNPPINTRCVKKTMPTPTPPAFLTPVFGGGGDGYTLLIALLYTVSDPTIHHYLITRLQCQCAHNCDNYSKWWSNFRALNGALCALRCHVFLQPVTQVERGSERGRPRPEPDTFSGGR